ncbi:MAG: ferredoxin [Solirubrobacteraceae bacterium]|jgi:ferredoxin
MTYLARIDEGACAAHGDCVDIAPDVFALDDVARVIGTAPDEVLLAAAEACPSAAILLVDQRTDEQVYP